MRPAPIPANKRDSRIDALRGLALLTIFIDHVPLDAANWFTIHNFSFSDAAEVFVLLAGASSMLAYGPTFERTGTYAGVAKVAARCGRIYGLQVILFLTTMGLARFRQEQGLPNPIAGQILDAGWTGIARGLLLDALPTYLDILPLYIALLAIFPMVYAANRMSPWLALTVSGAVWLEVNATGSPNLPNMLSADGWYFDPFAWQFLFVIGAVSARRLKAISARLAGMRLLRLLCVGYLAFGCLETLNWAHWGLPDFSPIAMEQPDKTLLSPYRLASILSLFFLLFSFPSLATLCEHRLMGPLVACGRHSLALFGAGCLLAYAGRLMFELFGPGWTLQVGVNLAGIGATFALALALDRRRRRHAVVQA